MILHFIRCVDIQWPQSYVAYKHNHIDTTNVQHFRISFHTNFYLIINREKLLLSLIKNSWKWNSLLSFLSISFYVLNTSYTFSTFGFDFLHGIWFCRLFVPMVMMPMGDGCCYCLCYYWMLYFHFSFTFSMISSGVNSNLA